jgi:hypothetical protein
MICPQCRAEYRSGIERCADCGVALVATLPAEEHDAPELVPVFELHDPADLLAVESALDGAGIPFELDDESAVPGASLAGLDPVGRVASVLVPRQHAEEARRLLASGDKEDDGAGDDDVEDDEDWDDDEDEDDEDGEDWDDDDDWTDDDDEDTEDEVASEDDPAR